MTDVPVAIIEIICCFVIIEFVIVAFFAGCQLYTAIRRLKS